MSNERLEYLRSQIRAECISYGEIAELQGLVNEIEPGDVELLEWAGVGEHGISPEGLALGHRYVMGNVNAYCPKCSEEHSAEAGRQICVLDCDYDLDK